VAITAAWNILDALYKYVSLNFATKANIVIWIYSSPLSIITLFLLCTYSAYFLFASLHWWAWRNLSAWIKHMCAWDRTVRSQCNQRYLHWHTL